MSKPRMVEIDRLSNLPGNIIDDILKRLPAKGAARTCVLSKNWRSKWAELSFLTLDEHDFPHGEFVSIVSHILLVHIGPILKLKLKTMTKDYKALDCWIVHVSRNRITELELRLGNEDYQLPLCVFSCQSLDTLICSNSTLKLPQSFTGFKNMKNLELHNMTIEQDDFENLVSRCPLLERLKIDDNEHSFTQIKINAPKLQYLCLSIVSMGVSFENVSCLAEAFLRCVGSLDADLNTVNLVKSFVHLPTIRKLDIDSCFLKRYYDVGSGKLLISFDSLEDLCLQLELDNYEDCVRALCFFKNTPNLTKLTIMMHDEEPFGLEPVYLWENDSREFMFSKLQFVEMIGCRFNGTKRELSLFKLILSNSPMLEKMVVNSYYENIKQKFLTNLWSFHRASTHARITCLKPGKIFFNNY